MRVIIKCRGVGNGKEWTDDRSGGTVTNWPLGWKKPVSDGPSEADEKAI